VGIYDAFDEGDIAEVNWGTGEVRNLTKGTNIKGQALPAELQSIVEVGGVEVMLKKEGFVA
jgi:3-isopropylmalate/(R)-2-methylmalate dehydratase small subunit